ncbi:MAG: 2-amino-4-hydroxy-6-hydroxymethyldihydropteridine diphosphokinase [Cytophagales bacterium]|nr:2-amino-4-hydroxy-6-hydroxymethyldihydropteridine diphosphokinase [Cytophaga sp.]
MSYMNKAAEMIAERIGNITHESSFYETKAWGVEAQPDFLNKVLICTTSLRPKEVLDHCLTIEKELGRNRKEKWGSRIIDIDILYADQEIIVSKELNIPHPFLHERRFTLVPLCEVMPDQLHPIFNLTNEQMLERCLDPLEVIVLNHK